MTEVAVGASDADSGDIEDTEVAVVGAGIVGLVVAHDLARRDVAVTVYERDGVAAGASGRAAGVCYDAFATMPDAELGREAIDRFRSFARAGAPFEPCPYLWFAQAGDERRIEEISAGLDRMDELGVDVERIDPVEISERYPHLRTDDIAIAGRSTAGGYTDPASFTDWLAARARAAGVTLSDETPVMVDVDTPAVRHQDSGRQAGTIACEPTAIVVAAGAHTSRLLADAGVAIAMKPYRVQALVGSIDESGISHSEPMWYDATAGYYTRPHSAGLFAGNGTVEQEADPDTFDQESSPGFEDGLLDRVEDRIPGYSISVERSWAGLCTATPDRQPLVGERRPGVYVATGFQGQGFMRAPAIGRRLAEEILGGPGIPAFDPNRFDGDEDFEIREGMAID